RHLSGETIRHGPSEMACCGAHCRVALGGVSSVPMSTRVYLPSPRTAPHSSPKRPPPRANVPAAPARRMRHDWMNHRLLTPLACQWASDSSHTTYQRSIIMPRFLSRLALAVAAAFLVVVSVSFSPTTIGTLAFAISIGTLVVSA